MADHHLFPILDRFHDVQWDPQEPSRGECKCPAHDDGTKKDKSSLHLKIKPDEKTGKPKLVLYCHAGCTAQQIVQSLGLGLSALFPDQRLLGGSVAETHPSTATRGTSPAKPTTPGRKPYQPPADEKLVGIYNYKDPDGNVLHQTLRYEPKRFRQRRVAENKVHIYGNREYKPHTQIGYTWIYTLQGIEPVPYHLPQITKMPDLPIFFVEGEKDADRVARLELLTTTVPMGSGKWRKSYADWFRGRVVYILPDHDTPLRGQTDPSANAGFNGAKAIAAELIKVAREVRIVYLPADLPQFAQPLTPKWDTSDWLDAGGTREELLAACEAAEILTPGHPGLIPSGRKGGDSHELTPSTPDGMSGAGAGNPGSPGTPGTTALTTEVVPPVVTNFYQGADDKLYPENINNIIRTIKLATSNWPKRIGTSLFYCNAKRDYEIRWFKNSAAIFSWIGALTQPVEFVSNQFCHPKEEVFQELQSQADAFEMIDHFPHEPPCPNFYYACEDLDQWKSERPGCLMEFLSMFNPATPIDRDLMLAMILTLLWGGPGGSRPLFVVTAQSGRGAGKTTFAELVCSLVGGSMNLSSNADDEVTRARILSPEGMRKRAVLLDNVKANKFSWAELESLITSETVSGKRMFVGEASRPNMITYMMTINGPAFSSDLAQRSVVIKLDRPKHEGEWIKNAKAFANEHRKSIIAEALEILRGEEVKLESYTRFGQWELDVLSRLPNAESCLDVIKERRKEIDSERDESEEIEAVFERMLDKNHMRPNDCRTFISSATAAEWYKAAVGGHGGGTVSACRSLKRLIDEGKLPSLEKAQHAERIEGSTRRERGFWWVPPNVRNGSVNELDVETNRPGNMQLFDLSELDFDTDFMRS